MMRRATVDDAANLAALSIQVWLHTYATQGIRRELSNYVLTELTEVALASALADPAERFTLYEGDGHLLGFIRLKTGSVCPTDPDCTTEIVTLYVQSHFVGQGIGADLLRHTLSGCETDAVWLTVYHGNTRAISFYKREGFTSIGSTWFELGTEKHENIIMQKQTVALGHRLY